MVSTLPRRPTNVSLDPKLVTEAKSLGVNVSRACEEGLVIELRKAREERWKAENAAAINGWNDWMLKHGLPGEDIRAWR